MWKPGTDNQTLPQGVHPMEEQQKKIDILSGIKMPVGKKIFFFFLQRQRYLRKNNH